MIPRLALNTERIIRAKQGAAQTRTKTLSSFSGSRDDATAVMANA
jgi:hypothetical protein